MLVLAPSPMIVAFASVSMRIAAIVAVVVVHVANAVRLFIHVGLRSGTTSKEDDDAHVCSRYLLYQCL